MTAAVEPGHVWEGVRALREGIQGLREQGLSPELSFLYGITADGKLTSLAAASLIVLGYGPA
ncbi:MAG: hypothetical protein LC722_01380 [Actinobacteria bacterium]|nr:hypothetical protein [Actinomycetota bacterium]